jgi:hypothetical protein
VGGGGCAANSPIPPTHTQIFFKYFLGGGIFFSFYLLFFIFCIFLIFFFNFFFLRTQTNYAGGIRNKLCKDDFALISYTYLFCGLLAYPYSTNSLNMDGTATGC